MLLMPYIKYTTTRVRKEIISMVVRNWNYGVVIFSLFFRKNGVRTYTLHLPRNTPPPLPCCVVRNATPSHPLDHRVANICYVLTNIHIYYARACNVVKGILCDTNNIRTYPCYNGYAAFICFLHTPYIAPTMPDLFNAGQITAA